MGQKYLAVGPAFSWTAPEPQQLPLAFTGAGEDFPWQQEGGSSAMITCYLCMALAAMSTV